MVTLSGQGLLQGAHFLVTFTNDSACVSPCVPMGQAGVRFGSVPNFEGDVISCTPAPPFSG